MPAMMVNTSQASPTRIISGPVSRMPIPSVSRVSTNSTKKMIATVMLKFSASLAWSSTKDMVSFFMSQITSGPMKQPMLPAQPAVTMPPASADRCANMAHWRSSAGMPLSAPTGAGLMSFIVSLPSHWAPLRRQRPMSVDWPVASRATHSARGPGHDHAAYQDRPGADVRSRVDFAAHGLDRAEHRLQVAGDGDAVDRIRQHAVLDHEAGGAARIVAGDGVEALPHQFGDEKAEAHAL